MANKSFRILEKGRVLPDELILFLDGQAFSGWETVSIVKDIQSIAHSFSISLFDKFTGLKQNWPLKPGVKVHFHMGKDSVTTGFIEKLDPNFSEDQRGFSISGRSPSGDLVDCGHIGKFEFNDVEVIDLAKELTAPFKIKPIVSVATKKLPKFAVKPGESVFEALDRVARLQGFFWISTEEGNIRLTRPGAARAFSSLEQDVNMKLAGAAFDDSKRFSQYVVKSQLSGKDEFAGENATEAEGSAKDAGVTRYRPLVLISESSGDSSDSQVRAQWEAATRLGQATNVEVTVRGWRQANGALWDINQIVRLKSSFLGLDRSMLISKISYEKSNSAGTTASLTLVDKNAFNPKPELNTDTSEDIFAGIGDAD